MDDGTDGWKGRPDRQTPKILYIWMEWSPKHFCPLDSHHQSFSFLFERSPKGYTVVVWKPNIFYGNFLSFPSLPFHFTWIIDLKTLIDLGLWWFATWTTCAKTSTPYSHHSRKQLDGQLHTNKQTTLESSRVPYSKMQLGYNYTQTIKQQWVLKGPIYMCVCVCV
jgi:hypothetical protein